MARRTDRAPQPTRSAPHRHEHTRSAATAHRLSAPLNVPQPRENAEAIRSEHPIMHWVLVTDENGRTYPESRWL